MSVGRTLRIVAPPLLATLASLFGWMVLAPLALLVPKRRDWIAVIGRADGLFTDNSKYLFLQAGQIAPRLHWVFVTEDPETAARIARSSRAALHYPSVAAIWFLLRCGTVIVDESSWYKRGRFFLLIRAKTIQLWHGVGCKRIELDRWRHEAGSNAWASYRVSLWMRLLIYRLTGRWMRYDAVVTTSRFYRDAVFAPAFHARHHLITGYPRNDFALSLRDRARELAWSNVDAAIRSQLHDWGASGRRLVLVAPTFRDSGSLPMQLDAVALQAIERFAATNGVEFIFKFHPAERNADNVSGPHFHVCDRDSDIYPVLPHVAALVTDYSSISMDFLLVDRPLLFLVPERDDYASHDRELQFDPRTMMPGPIVANWEALLPALIQEWSHDHYGSERAALRHKAFDELPQAEAVPRLLGFMYDQGWIKPPD